MWFAKCSGLQFVNFLWPIVSCRCFRSEDLSNVIGWGVRKIPLTDARGLQVDRVGFRLTLVDDKVVLSDSERQQLRDFETRNEISPGIGWESQTKPPDRQGQIGRFGPRGAALW